MKTLIAFLLRFNSRPTNFILSVVFSFASSIRYLSIVKVSFDGEDWIHKWKGGALVSSHPIFHSIYQTAVNIPLFTTWYTPKTGDVVIDLGAGDGTELEYFSKSVGVHGKVIAIEADRDAFRRLTKLVHRRRLSNVTAILVAIGATEGVGQVVKLGESGIANQVRDFIVPSSSLETVPIITLDCLIQDLELEEVNYIKINIEGFELRALTGFQLHHSKVINWCISCHDFLESGEIRTFQDVRQWLDEKKLRILENPQKNRGNFEQFYVFAKRMNSLEDFL